MGIELNNMTTADKFNGVIFGQAIGDALGLEAYSFSYYDTQCKSVSNLF